MIQQFLFGSSKLLGFHTWTSQQMEVDKKKKKNKKKNKQATKQTECATVDATESISDDQSYVSEMGPDNNSQILEIQVSQNDLGPKIDVDMDKSFANGAEGVSLSVFVWFSMYRYSK